MSVQVRYLANCCVSGGHTVSGGYTGNKKSQRGDISFMKRYIKDKEKDENTADSREFYLLRTDRLE